MDNNTPTIKACKLKAIKGFSYKKKNSIIFTKIPDLGIIFYLQCSLRFYNGDQFREIHQTQNQIEFISVRDEWLAIGEKMYKGQLTNTTFLNILTKQTKTFKFQKTKTTHLSISKDGKYLCSVGSSSSTKQQIFILDARVTYEDYSGKIIYEEQVQKKNGEIVDVCFSHNNQNLLGILHKNKFVILKILGEGTLFESKIAKSNKVRQFSSMTFDPWDSSCFVASKNGDISEISLQKMKEVRIGPRKRVIIAGIKHIRYLKSNLIIITGVKGFIALIDVQELKILKEATLKQEIINLTEFEGDLGFLSTQKANIYIIDGSNLGIKSFFTCHNSRINQICFVQNFNEIFATCGGSEINVWNTHTLDPVLKIELPKKQCLCLNLTRDGKLIIGGWNDDCIRIYSPTTGKMLKKMQNVHSGMVTAMISNISSDRLISGADNGSIRIWRLQNEWMGLLADSFSAKSRVHYFELKDDYLAFCTEDGSFCIWNIKKSQKIVENQVNNFLKQIQMIDNYHILAVGSGPNLLKIRKNDGQINEKIFLGGSHHNAFDYILKGESKKYYFLGGESKKLIFFHYYELKKKQERLVQEFDTFSQITTIKISPDKSKVIVGTQKGFLLSFDINNIFQST